MESANRECWEPYIYRESSSYGNNAACSAERCGVGVDALEKEQGWQHYESAYRTVSESSTAAREKS